MMKKVTLQIDVFVPNDYPDQDLVNDVELALECGEEVIKNDTQLVHRRIGYTWDVKLIDSKQQTDPQQSYPQLKNI